MAKDLHILHFTNEQIAENIESGLKAIIEKTEDIEELRDLRQAKAASKDESYISLEEARKILDLN